MINVKVESLMDTSTVLYPADGVFHKRYDIKTYQDESRIKIRCRRDYIVPFGIYDDDYPYSVLHVRLIGIGEEDKANGQIIENRKLNALDLIFQNVSVYIMNDDGETIDKIVQSSDHNVAKTGPSTNRLLDMDIMDYEEAVRTGSIEEL